MPVTPDIVGNKDDGIFYRRGSEADEVSVTAFDALDLPDPITTKVLLPGPKASLLEFRLSAGQAIPAHRFPHSTITYLVRGRVRVTLAGHQYEASPRDTWSAVAGAEIAIDSQEESVLLQWMSTPHLLVGRRLITWGPVVPAESHLFTRWDDIQLAPLKLVEGETEFGPTELLIAAELKVMIPGPEGSMLWVLSHPGKWALHAHRHHWVCYLIKGTVREKFGGTVDVTLKAGDTWAAESGALHCTMEPEGSETVEFKWPPPLYAPGTIQSWGMR